MLEIEIVETNIIEGGVEVFVRAFRDGQQIGFGKDGTVDIERFRIFNPPILVLDVDGAIVRESYDEVTGETTITKYREDAEEAILQTIEHSISIVGKDGSNIIAGKIGQTTTTVYPNANPETTTVDGRVIHAGSLSFSALIGSAGGAFGQTDNATNNLAVFIDASSTTNVWENLTWMIALFNTSVVDSGDTISSATISLYPQSSGFSSFVSHTLQVAVVSSNPSSNTSLTGSVDFDSYGTTEFATRKSVTAMTSGSYHDFSLNASGLANITKGGISKFGFINGMVLDGESWENNKEGGVNLYQADQAGTTNDPKLVVEHSAGGAPRRIFNIS